MKKYYLIIVFVIGLLQACSNETDLIYDKPVSERMKETLDNYQKILTSNTKGWVVDYYPEANQSYGGYNLYFQFTEDGVTVKSNVKSSYLQTNEATSTYKLNDDMGPTLNFDSYNAVLNFFSDPALPIGGGNGFGFEGDYEFIFMSGDESEVILRGKKSKNTIRLTPLNSDSWEKYCDDIETVRKNITSQNYSIEVDGNIIESVIRPTIAYNRFIIKHYDNDNLVTTNISFIVTPTGIRFYEPLTINGITIQDLTYQTESGQLVSTDGKVIITPIFLPPADIFINSISLSKWYFSSKEMGSEFLNGFNAMKTALGGIGELLYNAWIGGSPKSMPSFSYQSYSGNLYAGSNLLNVEKIAGQADQVKITVTNLYENDGSWYANNVPPLKTFTLSLGGVYIVDSEDEIKGSNTLSFKDPTNPNRSFTLSLAEVILP